MVFLRQSCFMSVKSSSHEEARIRLAPLVIYIQLSSNSLSVFRKMQQPRGCYTTLMTLPLRVSIKFPVLITTLLFESSDESSCIGTVEKRRAFKRCT